MLPKDKSNNVRQTFLLMTLLMHIKQRTQPNRSKIGEAASCKHIVKSRALALETIEKYCPSHLSLSKVNKCIS